MNRIRWRPGNSTRRRGRRRTAAASVEMALCVPVMALLIFGSLEGTSMLFLRQAVVQAAYEAAKAGAKSNGSQARGETLAREILAARRVEPTAIEFSPASVDDLERGQVFSVSVSVPSEARSFTGFGPFAGRTIRATATMMKE